MDDSIEGGKELLAETVRAFKTGLRGDEYVPGSGGSPGIHRQEELTALVKDAMDRSGVPGAVVGISQRGEEMIECFGVTNTENPLDVVPDTLFQIGSVTKVITGTAIMRLVDEGRMNLDAPVRQYIPDFRVADENTSANVTVRHLLTHTAGWDGDFFMDPMLNRGDDALQRAVQMMTDLPQLSPIGEIWAYNNAAFYIVGRLIELVTGKPYEVAVRELVLHPLKMHQSYFFPEEIMTYRFAVGHQLRGEDVKVIRQWNLSRSAHPAGGLITTVSDMLQFARFHMGDGTTTDGDRLLSPESVALMQAPYTSADNGSFVGLTWFIKDIAGVRTLSHGGDTNGQYSNLLIVPEEEFALILMVNADDGHTLSKAILTWALRQYCGVEEAPPEILELPQNELASYAGRYVGTRAYLELKIEDGHLMGYAVPTEVPPFGGKIPPPPPPFRVAPVNGGRLMFLDPPSKGMQAEILRDGAGNIAWLRFAKRIWARQST